MIRTVPPVQNPPRVDLSKVRHRQKPDAKRLAPAAGIDPGAVYAAEAVLRAGHSAPRSAPETSPLQAWDLAGIRNQSAHQPIQDPERAPRDAYYSAGEAEAGEAPYSSAAGSDDYRNNEFAAEPAEMRLGASDRIMRPDDPRRAQPARPKTPRHEPLDEELDDEPAHEPVIRRDLRRVKVSRKANMPLIGIGFSAVLVAGLFAVSSAMKSSPAPNDKAARTFGDLFEQRSKPSRQIHFAQRLDAPSSASTAPQPAPRISAATPPLKAAPPQAMAAHALPAPATAPAPPIPVPTMPSPPMTVRMVLLSCQQGALDPNSAPKATRAVFAAAIWLNAPIFDEAVRHAAGNWTGNHNVMVLIDKKNAPIMNLPANLRIIGFDRTTHEADAADPNVHVWLLGTSDELMRLPAVGCSLRVSKGE